MKKVLIAYASKTGTAKTCAELLEKELKGLQVTLADLDREQPDVGDYDAVVVGGSIRCGSLRKSASAFLRERQDDLQKKPLGLFLCCGFEHDFEEYCENVFSDEFRAHAFAVMSFGGTLKLKNAGLAERILLYFVRSHIRESEIDDGVYTPTLPVILPENISMMASHLRNELTGSK